MVKGTRVTIRTILASLAEGATVDQLLADFPSLTEEDVADWQGCIVVATDHKLRVRRQ